MMKIAMSTSASAVLRALIARAAVDRNRILLTDAQSIDWQSLTFTGERHRLCLRVTGPDSSQVIDRMCDGLEDAEFNIRGVLVADIGIAGDPRRTGDESMEVVVEALTVSED